MKPAIFCTWLVWLLPYLLPAQSPRCGFDEAHRQRLQAMPAYRKAVEQQNQQARQYIQQIRSSRGAQKVMATVQIPIVVHIVHTGQTAGSFFNPSDAQVQSTVDYMNQLYAGVHSSNDPGGVGDIGIQFVLAQRDPHCNPTNGINHVDGSALPGYAAHGVNLNGTAGISDTTLRNFIRWDPAQYYNIYVVNKIDDFDAAAGSGTGVAGFAYFPGLSELDGTIIVAGVCAPGNYILPHELGHAFNLYHPFEGGNANTCPFETDPLADGDQVPDTDPITLPLNFECRPNTAHPMNYCVNAPAGIPYSINTERNIMNYSGCNTYLFTAGQKDRIQAALLLPIRQSLVNSAGGLPTNDAILPCAPRINFAPPVDTILTEQTSDKAGCSGYRDHTFALTIGNSPAIAAQVNLTVSSGTATAGQDMELLTPTIIFPAGVDTAQYYTIRIYDDASVEGNEDFVLSFTVSNGGGNAEAGDALPAITFRIADNDEAPHAAMPLTFPVGSSTGVIASPFMGNLPALKSQMLYKAAELQAAGMSAGPVTGLLAAITKNSPDGFTYHNMTIKMAVTTRAHLFAPGGTIPLNDAAHTVVYTGDFTPLDGDNSISFTTPFNWDGVSNIVITICYNNGAAITSGDENMPAYADDVYSSSQADYVVQQSINDCSAPITSFTTFANGRKPRWHFIGMGQQTPVQTAVNAAATVALGPWADVYLYDSIQQHLLARVKNLSAHDYGCTSMLIDRAGTGATAFASSQPASFLMDKTVRILPEHNDPEGAYELTLYYAESEVQGWEAASGQLFDNIQLIKVPGRIPDVTPQTPGAAGPPEVVIPVRGTLGTHRSLTASFNTGFSGFGAGIMATALPVTMVELTGRISDDHMHLQWKTTSETGFRGFYIERSYDGLQFTAIGFVPAAGAANGIHTYTFRDKALAQEENYYRLKAVDKDDHIIYTKIISATNVLKNTAVIISNPVYTMLEVQWNRSLSGMAEMRLTDISGRVVQFWRGPVARRMQVVLSPAVHSGLYLVQWQAGGETIVKKVLVQ